tara:strand:- start:1955 stop:2815 length:861 start_codon:yes stop_codon:yes gene_type:complete
MPTITFKTYNKHAFEFFRPIPASKVQPDWWKKSKIHMLEKGIPSITLRACPAMHDWLATGYMIQTMRDIHCNYEDDYWFASVPWNEEEGSWEESYASPTHNKAQLMGENFTHLKPDESGSRPYDAFKFRVPWSVMTPPGYSCLYLDPFLHQNKYYRTWQGMMDTDMFNTGTDSTQIIMYPTCDHSFIIPKGSVVAQIVPYRREKWVASYLPIDGEEYIKERNSRSSEYEKPSIEELSMVEGDADSPDGQIPGGFYRKYMWSNKSKNFKDAPPDECPFDPKTGKMKE